MSLAIDGLVSGMKTTELINALMQVEAVPQGILKKKVSKTQSMINALQDLNSKIASLAELAKKTAKPAALDLFKATSTSDKVTATTTKGANAGEIDILVGKLAMYQISVTGAMVTWPYNPPVFTVTGADGVPMQITPDSGSLDDIVKAVNASDAGVKAVKVSAGNGEFRLQFSGTETGAAGAFTIEAAGAPVPLTEIRAAQDAEVTLWAGTGAEQTIKSTTNTFTELLPGVDVTVAEASATPVTISVARDNAQISKIAEDFVSALNGIFALISTKSVVTPSTGPDGKPLLSAGVFTGDSTVRSVNQSILSAASMPINGQSSSSIGISITKRGTLEFDAEKFQKALAEDPVKVEAVMQELASRVATAATDASDKYDGQITSKITGQESLVKSLSEQVLGWDRRLESRRSALERTYTAMEVRLSGMNAQMSWLTSQISAMPSPNRQ